jgi:hypothetical protein
MGKAGKAERNGKPGGGKVDGAIALSRLVGTADRTYLAGGSGFLGAGGGTSGGAGGAG